MDDHVIGSGMTEQELKLASFWVRNKPTLQKIGYGTLITISVLLWLFVAWSLLDAYAISYPRESRIPTHILQNQLSVNGLSAAGPKQIEPSEVSVFDSTSGRQDFLVELSNPNVYWWADFDYRFDVAGELTPPRTGYILPHSQRYVTELGFESKTKSRTAKLVVDEIRWHRVDPAVVGPDFEAFRNSRSSFRFDNISYAHDLKVGTQTIGQTNFDLVNESAYGFWSVELTVILFRGTTPVGVTTITRQEIKPGQTTPISINWFENLTGISKTEIQANVHLLDPAAYLPSTRL